MMMMMMENMDLKSKKTRKDILTANNYVNFGNKNMETKEPLL